MILLLLFFTCLQALTVTRLRVEYLSDPQGVVNKPRFSWHLTDSTRSQAQTAYQIVVSSTSSQSGDFWDSGKVLSSKSYLIRYDGKPLTNSTRFWWKVRVWDMNGLPSDFSSVATFLTGATNFNNATWITGGDGNNQIRTEFSVPSGTLQKAILHISGLGYYELYCNGVKVGDHMLDVGWTDYQKRVYYVTWDISNCIVPNTNNALGVVLGNSWFACAGGQPGCLSVPPQLLLLANIQTSGGSIQVTSNVNSWKAAPGPITFNSLYNGETYDARMETPGWASPNFNQSANWKSVMRGTVVPMLISPQLFEPIRKLQTFSPRYISEPQPGMFVIDFGQNTAGLVSIVIRNCQAGQKVTLRHAELLMHPPYGPADGSIYVGNLRGAKATDVYICKGMGKEIYSPTFTQHGFRFVEVTGLSESLVEEDIVVHEMHTDVEEIGTVATTDRLLNQIQHNVVWGQKSNLMSVPTDCPQRDERRGWMGDAALTAEEAMLNFEMSAVYTNWLNIIRDDQHGDGSVTNFVPDLGDGSPGAPNWQTAYPTILWVMLKYRGDSDVVKDHWASMNAYINFFNTRYKATGLKNFFTGFGDWCPPPPARGADLHLVAAFSYLRDLMLFSDLAKAVGEDELGFETDVRLKDLKDEFNTAFYDSNKKVYGSGLQTETAMGIWLDCVPAADKPMVITNLVNDILITNKIHPTTGILGWKFMLEALTTTGHSDVGIVLNQQDTYPSFGYMIQGATNPEHATTVWELWDSDVEGPGMNSRNHIMFGTVGSWLYKALLGFFANGDTIGVGPEFSVVNVHNITEAQGKTLTPFGTVEVGWFVASPASCGIADEGETVDVKCSSGVITSITAYYGTPQGTCATGFHAGSCNSTNAYTAVKNACLGKQSCSIPVSNAFFGGDPCVNTPKYLDMSVLCSTSNVNPSFNLQVSLPIGQKTLVNIPIVPNLKQTPQNLQINEGTTVIWSNGKFRGGPGIISGVVNPSMTGITLTVASGVYNFEATGV